MQKFMLNNYYNNNNKSRLLRFKTEQKKSKTSCYLTLEIKTITSSLSNQNNLLLNKMISFYFFIIKSTKNKSIT